MTQLQLPTSNTSQQLFNNAEACQEALARAMRCRMIIQSVHGSAGDCRCQRAAVSKRLAELDRQIAEAREQLAAFSSWR